MHQNHNIINKIKTMRKVISADGINYEQILDFTSEIPACCFTEGNNGYYFGLGNREFKGNSLMGTVYFIAKE